MLSIKVARVVSSLLAAAILNMRGVGGKPGWFWLFLLEGLITFTIGAVVSNSLLFDILFYIHPSCSCDLISYHLMTI